MDYAKPVIFERLTKVINGKKSGISKSVNWQGGGSFIFCELAKANQEYIDKINDAEESKTLLKIWRSMQDKAFISYKVDIKAINDNVAKFEELPLEDQKRFLIEILDKNMLYVPYSEIDDADYNISDEDKKLNHKFYGGKA
jgi:adenine-specific DNA-methyltransferase